MKPPAFIRDLYGDLRDRRLLPVAAVLLVAIPSVPLLLGSDATAPQSDAPMSETLAEGIPTDPAVLTSDADLRDYRERLKGLRSKNPFAQQFQEENPEGAAAASVTEVEIGGSSSGAGSSPDSVSGSTSSGGSVGTTSGTTMGGSSSTSSSSAQSSTASDGGGGGGSSTNSGTQWFTARIDVVTGPAGDAEERKNVKRLTPLPSQSNPVALFLGASEGAKRVTFLVSDDVVRTHGQGNCLPSPSDCQILELEPGQERRFAYAPRGEPETFVIKLNRIRVVEIDKPKGAPEAKRSQADTRLRSFLGL